MPRLYDISPAVTARTAVWPGDVPFAREVACDMAEGANLTLSAIRTTVHIGAHADARNHYLASGAGIAAHPLEPYIGPCQVIELDLPRGQRILPEALGVEVRAPRVLLKTGSFPDPEVFNEDFNSLSPELVAELSARGVILIGIDTPSIDPFESKALESHQAIAEAGVYNLEGLVLSEVPAGVYELIALPLRLVDADASPVRAILRELS